MVKKLHLDNEDVRLVLENKLGLSDYELVQYDIQQYDTKIGLLGDHAFLKAQVRIHINDEVQQFHFFLKYYPQEEISDAFAKETGAFRKEALINGEIFNNFDRIENDSIYKCVPKSYLQKDYVIVFEDLTKDGYTIIDKTTDCDFQVMLAILKSLAQLHASSLIYEEKKSQQIGNEYRLIEEYEIGLQEAFYSKDIPLSYQSANASFKALQTEIKYFEFPENLPSGKSFAFVVNECCKQIFDLVKPSQKHRNVVCHGDLWFSNIFLKGSETGTPSNCKFVDFQLYRYVPPSHDVMAAIFLNTCENFRKKHLYELIGLYYTELERYLKLAGFSLRKIIPFNDFLESCEEQKLFAVIQSAAYAQLIYLDNDVLTEFFANASLCEYALYEDKSVLVLAQINKNEYYRNKLKDTIQCLWNYCQWF